MNIEKHIEFDKIKEEKEKSNFVDKKGKAASLKL